MQKQQIENEIKDKIEITNVRDLLMIDDEAEP